MERGAAGRSHSEWLERTRALRQELDAVQVRGWCMWHVAGAWACGRLWPMFFLYLFPDVFWSTEALSLEGESGGWGSGVWGHGKVRVMAGAKLGTAVVKSRSHEASRQVTQVVQHGPQVSHQFAVHPHLVPYSMQATCSLCEL